MSVLAQNSWTLHFGVRITALKYSIRRATTRDGAAVARLAAQLGYPAPSDVITARLVRILATPRNCILVATSARGMVGWIHGVVSQSLESDFRVEIAGLVVDESSRRHGIGRALVLRLERWAARQGAVVMTVRCKTTRPAAHVFYETAGYIRNKRQIVFRKSLIE